MTHVQAVVSVAGLAIAFAALPSVPSAARPALDARPALELVEVAAGVYAALQPEAARFDDANATVIVLDDGVLVVDTHVSPLRARDVIAAIRARTTLPVRWVVNTHWHGDHVQGNQAYREAWPEAQFIAHEATARDIQARAMPSLAEEKETVPAWLERARAALESGVADGQTLTAQQLTDLRGRLSRREDHWTAIREVTDFVVPSRTFRDTLTLGGEARLIHHEGHTEGDIVVWLSARRVLITGDLLDDLPYTGHGSPRALLETLRGFERYDFDVIVPGHGAIRRGRGHLRDVIGLFESIVRQTAEAKAAGLDADAAVERVDLSAFRDRFVVDDASGRYWGFFTMEAVRRAWAEEAPPRG